MEEDIEDEDPGRIIVNLEYEMTSHQKETYGSVENRVIGRVQIQHDDTFAIVPVVKVSVFDTWSEVPDFRCLQASVLTARSID